MTAALHRETSTVPIVFVIVSDPVGSGLVAGLPRPGGNITGFTNVEAATGGKWLSLLKEIAPGIKRAAFVFNPDTAPGGGKHFLASFEASAGSLGIESVAMPVRSDAEIETAVATLGAEQAGPFATGASKLQVRNAPLATVGAKKAAGRPQFPVRSPLNLSLWQARAE